MSSKELSAAKCTLLTVHYASLGDIKTLRAFTPSRNDVLTPDLVLRILLTYLPETLEPSVYASYTEEVATRIYIDVNGVEESEIDLSPVAELTEVQAEKKVKCLHLLPIRPPSIPPHGPEDLLTLFLVQRAKRVDEKTGLLGMVPQLIEPHLHRNDWLRDWYISVVLPLVRMQLDYYPPEAQATYVHLDEFEHMEGKKGVDLLLRQHDGGQEHATAAPSSENLSRDLKGLVGPWMYGSTERKRRKMNPKQAKDDARAEQENKDATADVTERVSRISLNGISAEDKTGHDWEYVYRWLVHRAQSDFPLATRCIEDWDGPGDVDLGGFKLRPRDYLDDDLQTKLELQYGQAAFAICYVAQGNTKETISGAHGVLARLAELLDFIPPPDLATSVDSLPRIERHATMLEASKSTADLAPDYLLIPEHPLTTPRIETYMLLQMMVYSAYQLLGLGHAIAVVNVAKLHFYATAEEQLDMLKKILKTLAASDTRKDETQWSADRAKLVWLWNWGIGPEDEGDNTEGAGVLGRIPKQTFETQMLETILDTSVEEVNLLDAANPLGGVEKKDLSFPFCLGFKIATKLYLSNDEGSSTTLLPRTIVEDVVLAKVLESYDGASNGNKTRGGVKKANDIFTTFRPYFPDSTRFREVGALIAATHALSFYSLTLQHGVPFQPVSIRVSKDPIRLLDKVLEQNPRSYTKLDDLIGIGTNLVSAGLQTDAQDDSAGTLEKRREDTERRITFMAVEAALREDDFETAYSYIINRLTPSDSNITAPSDIDSYIPAVEKDKASLSSNQARPQQPEDDISWRAAFLAGRYRPSSSSPHTLRRLEQRTELLSLALVLAPAPALTEILGAWRRCEEETSALQRAEQQADQAFDDLADKRISTASLPGNFTVQGEQPEMILNQKRREVGRMGGGKGEADAPMSMFDLTRSAATALSRNAFPLSSRGAASPTSPDHATHTRTATLSDEGHSPRASLDGQPRVRRRDMVANAVSGSLVSGLGWVLGATPADAPVPARQQQE